MRALLVLALFAAPAHADEAAPPAQPEEEEVVVEESYRLQVIASDAAALGLFLLAFPAKDVQEELFITSGLIYAIGGPTIHGVHGQLGRSLASAGLRIAAPIAGYYLGEMADKSTYEGFSVKGFFGFVIGAGVAMVIDGGVIAQKVTRPRAAVTPTASPTPGGATFGLAGTF